MSLDPDSLLIGAPFDGSMLDRAGREQRDHVGRYPWPTQIGQYQLSVAGISANFKALAFCCPLRALWQLGRYPTPGASKGDQRASGTLPKISVKAPRDLDLLF